MTREEAINHGKEQLEIFGGEHREFIELAIKALEQQPCEDKQDCEHCIHTYGTLGCCDMVNNEWIYDCDFGREQYRKEHGKPCEDCISREALKKRIQLAPNKQAESWDELYDSIIYEIDKAPSVKPKTRWIPCSERLPEDEQEILFSTKTGRVHSGKYHDDDSANQWYSHRDKCRAWNNVVTAWMPLPQPYKAENEKNVCKDCYYNDGEVHAECVICKKAESEEE